MKKRLRKKFRMGEFKEYEFLVEFEMAPPRDPAAIGTLMETFLDHMDSLRLVGGGGSTEEGRFLFMVASNHSKVPTTDAHREALEAWLKGNPAILAPKVGPLVDAWN
jgi:hypothetical protein